MAPLSEEGGPWSWGSVRRTLEPYTDAAAPAPWAVRPRPWGQAPGLRLAQTSLSPRLAESCEPF